MNKFLITTVAILLVGCGNKSANDTTTQTNPSSVEQSTAQSANPTSAEMSPAAALPKTRQGSREQREPRERHDHDGASQPVVSVYLDPPLEEPAPVMVEWAPPPMLVDTPPPPPSNDAVWTGGYWAWDGNWIWAHGRWAAPPRQGYHWNNPYYEHRGNGVVFVNGYWRAPESTFVAPSPTLNIALAVAAVGVIAGQRPDGPSGVFVPPPPGSHHGLIVPAPIGTAPAVVVGAPPIVRGGMHIEITNNNAHTSNVNNITNISNVTNVTVVAPANATASGNAVNVTVPAQAHLAAAQTPVVNATAPKPVSSNPIPTYVAGHPPAALPAPQIAHSAALVTNAAQALPEQKGHPVAATAVSPPTGPATMAPPTIPAAQEAPIHGEHAVHSPQQSIRTKTLAHTDDQSQPQSNVAPVTSMEMRNPPQSVEAKAAQMEKLHHASIVKPVIIEKNPQPPALKVVERPVAKRPEPIQQNNSSPEEPSAPKAKPEKLEPKDGSSHDKDKHEAN